MSPSLLRSAPGWIAALGLAAAGAACAARTMRLPEGPGTPAANAAAMIDAATAGCRGVRTLQAELAIAGRAGRDKLRGRVIAGFERPGSMRLEAVAPFGPPAFILVAREGSAALLMPRDDRFLADAAPAAVIEALTGISLAPDDLLAILSGCPTSDRNAVAARTFAGGWAAVDAADGTTIYLRREASGWKVAAGIRERLRIEYGDGTGTGPSSVRLRVAGADGSVATELSIALSQVEVNASIDPRAFTLRAPARVVPLTLEELRRSGPLGQNR